MIITIHLNVICLYVYMFTREFVVAHGQHAQLAQEAELGRDGPDEAHPPRVELLQPRYEPDLHRQNTLENNTITHTITDRETNNIY